jgi:hypothetical protein
MVLNLRSWSQHSENFGDDAGWRFDGVGAGSGNNSHVEMHNTMEPATRRQRKDTAPTGGLDSSAHIEGPNLQTYNNVNVPSRQHIDIETETAVIAEDEAFHAGKRGEC